MKALIVHLGILMTLLTVIYGLWQQYDYEYLIFKSLEVFFIWLFGTSVFQIILKMIINKEEEKEEDEESEEEQEEEQEEAVEETGSE